MSRCVYIDHLSSRLEGSGVKVEAESADPWSYHKVLFHLAEANSTQHQLNFPVALYQMRYTQNVRLHVIIYVRSGFNTYSRLCKKIINYYGHK